MPDAMPAGGAVSAGPAADGIVAGVPLVLTFRYRHALGDLAPYFEGLLAGVLKATTCVACASAWAPPRLVCTCGASAMQWTALTGLGTVVSATQTRSSLPGTAIRGLLGFALVRFDGATNATLVRFDPADPVAAGLRVALALVGREVPAHPVQALRVVVAPGDAGKR